MIRKLIIAAIVANFVFILASVVVTRDDVLTPTFANTTIGGPAFAHVEGVLELVNAGIKRIPSSQTGNINPWDPIYPDSSSFDFGTLEYLSDQGYFIGQYWYCTLMIPVTSGRPFRISETGTALTGANGTIESNGFLQIPSYQYLDEMPEGTPQNATPGGAYLGFPSSAVGTHDVYTDPAPGGESRIIRGIIAIAGPEEGNTYPRNYSGGYNGNQSVGTPQDFTAWTPVGPSTQPGDYAGSVTFTLNLI